MIVASTCLLLGLLTSYPTTSYSVSDSTQRAGLTSQQLADDFTTFEHIYRTANSGLYKYRTQPQIDSVFAANRVLINAQTTLLDFYRLLYSVTDYTGSLHSDNYLPTRVDSLLRQEASFFPYPVKLVAGSWLLNTQEAPFPVGSTILTINGRPTQQVLHQIGRYATTDGYDQTGKVPLVNKHFPLYYRLEYGPAAEFELTYVPPAHTDTLRISLPAVAYRRYQASVKYRHSLPLEAVLPKYSFEVIDSLASARLTVRTFALGGPKRASHQRYARFLDSTFQFLRAHPRIRHLIVDVRQNGGAMTPMICCCTRT